jgi:oxygen-independent coproporphyrinogen-3 oxidase
MDRAIDLGVDHVALYALSPGEAGAEEDADVTWPDCRAKAADALARGGLVPYELTAFARAGHEERHRIDRCRGADYLGIGPYAHSFVGGERAWNVPSVARYLEAQRAGEGTMDGSERLSPNDAARERIMLGLHLRTGMAWNPDDPNLSPAQRSGLDARLSALVAEGDLVHDGVTLSLTAAGWNRADAVFAELLDTGPVV